MKHLVVGPGAMAYFMFLGTLSAFSDKGALNDLETISGSSAGALLGFLFILTKGDVSRVFEESVQIPVQKIMKPNIKTLLTSYGLVKSKKILGILKTITLKFCTSETLTFAELYTHWPIKFYVSACCVDLATTHYFSVDTHPSMSVHDALSMTIAIPFLFQSVKHDRWHYIDGGTLEETPCGAIISEHPESVHVIRLTYQNTTAQIQSLRAYGFQVMTLAMTLRHKYRMFPETAVDEGGYDIFDFTDSFDTKVKMFVKGYTSCTIFPLRVGNDHPQTPVEEQMPCQEHPEQTCDAADDPSQTTQDPQDEPMHHLHEDTFP